MRMTRHGNDLLVTDQSLGLGTFLVALGVFLLAAALGRLVDPDLRLTLATAAYAVAGALLIVGGLRRLIATQLIVDPDAQKVIVKRWSFAGADVQRIPFEAITGYAIEPEGQDKKTRLTIQTNRGDVAASGGMLGARAAWDEVVAAMRAHMTADGAANGPSARD